MAKGSPKPAERPGTAKIRFRDGGGEPRALQSRQRRDNGDVGLTSLWSLLQRRQDLDQDSRRLRLMGFSTEGVFLAVGRRIESELRLWCRRSGPVSWCRSWLVDVRSGRTKAAGGFAVTPAVIGQDLELAGIVLPVLEVTTVKGREQEERLEEPAGNLRFDLGLTTGLTGLDTGPLTLIGPEVVAGFGSDLRGPLIGPVYRGLNLGFILQNLQKGPRSNLMPRLLATKEAVEGVGSNPAGKGPALA